MILFKKAGDLSKWLDIQSQEGNSVGFVPTMGALHPGHISLLALCKQQNRVSVCSLFVNPTQFNNATDFDKYPVTIEKDIDLLEASGCDVIFLPTVKEIYPTGLATSTRYNLGYLETVLEGHYRPGHFQGVCRVVHRLLDIVAPDNLYLGQKDYQQCMVIRKLLELVHLSDNIQLVIGPTLRETDGLAMSSRNMRLSQPEREQATAIYRCLLQIKMELNPGSLLDLKRKALTFLEASGFKTDYVEIAGAADLSVCDHWDGSKKLVALAAAWLNEVRLIDNLVLYDE